MGNVRIIIKLPDKVSPLIKKSFLLVLAGILVGTFIITIVKAQSTEIIQACYAQPGSNSRSQNLLGRANTGSVRIVSSASDCRDGEIYITWNVQGPPGPAGPPGPSGPSGGAQLIIVDSENQQVGYYADDNLILFKINDAWVGVQTSINLGFESRDNFFVNYQSSDCSGTPLLSYGGRLSRPGWVVGNTVYYPGDPLITVFNSAREFTPPSTYGECLLFSQSGARLGAMEIYELPVFVPPFSIKP